MPPTRCIARMQAERGSWQCIKGASHPPINNAEMAGSTRLTLPLSERLLRLQLLSRAITHHGCPPNDRAHRPAGRIGKTNAQCMAAIELGFRLQFIKHTARFFSPVDSHNSGFELAPVNTNLVTTGFNKQNSKT